jgi:hypothetical protein
MIQESQELTGLPPDPECLHCYLSPLIAQWMESHPQVCSERIVQSVATVLGQLSGSMLYRGQSADRLDEVAEGLRATIAQQARLLISTLMDAQARS